MHWYIFTLLLLLDGIHLKTVSSYRKNLGKREANDYETYLDKFRKETLEEHNKLRKQHCVPELTLDTGLNNRAQTYAEKLVKVGKLVHSEGDGTYGENLYKKQSKPYIKSFNGTAATLAWYNEINSYDFNSPGFTLETGHFTQLVWKDTEKVGVGLAYSANKTSVYVVVQYAPPGNYDDEFQANVLPTSCQGSN